LDASFYVPDFTIWKVVYTAIGVTVFWGKWGRRKLQPFVLPSLLDVLPLRGKWRAALEFIIFVALGCLVGIGAANPINGVQALTAGFAWTGVFTHHKKQ
jgi:hypothetical protein